MPTSLVLGVLLDRQKVLVFGANEFVDLENDPLEDIGGVDMVFDVIGVVIGKPDSTMGEH